MNLLHFIHLVINERIRYGFENFPLLNIRIKPKTTYIRLLI